MCVLAISLSACTSYYRMSVSVRTIETETPLKQLAVQTEYNPAPWYWPFNPVPARTVTDDSGHAVITIADYAHGTFLRIAGTNFPLTRKNIAEGTRLVSYQFSANVVPLGRTSKPDAPPPVRQHYITTDP